MAMMPNVLSLPIALGNNPIEDEKLLRNAVTNAPLVLFSFNREGIFTLSEGKGLAALGLQPGEVVGRSIFDVYRTVPGIQEDARRALKGETLNVVRTVGGSTFETRYAPLVGADGEILGVTGAALDVTERKRLEQLEKDQSQVLEMVARNQPLKTILTYLIRMVERQKPKMLGSMMLLRNGRLYHEAAPSLSDRFIQATDGLEIGFGSGSCAAAAWKNESVFSLDIADAPVWENARSAALHHGFRACWAVPISSSQGAVLGTFALYSRSRTAPTAEDLHLLDTACRLASIALEQRQLTDQLAYQAQHDSLTGLPNRFFFGERLQQAIERAKRYRQHLALLYIDLDRFKQINDTLGHSMGDKLLQQVSQRLKTCIRQSDTLARMGGDEFTLILGELNDPRHAMEVARKLLETLKEPFIFEEGRFYITASIGISLYPGDGGDASSLQQIADTAMYYAKSQGRNTFQYFTSEMNVAAQARLELENSLRLALEGDEFELVYQPQVGMGGEWVGLEALLRWRHPELGVIPPGRFISLAEETGLIVPIGEWVLRQACRQAVQWQNEGILSTQVAVNVSALQFARSEFVETVARALKDTGLDSHWLDLELTESLLMCNMEAAAEKLRQLRELGVHISIDDFGTGYSSLTYLQRLPIDRLKIDQSFVQGIGPDPQHDQNSQAIVRAIVSLAHSLGLQVSAEGVETERQMEFLTSIGCNNVQGYLFSKPLHVEDLEELLRKLPHAGDN